MILPVSDLTVHLPECHKVAPSTHPMVHKRPYAHRFRCTYSMPKPHSRMHADAACVASDRLYTIYPYFFAPIAQLVERALRIEHESGEGKVHSSILCGGSSFCFCSRPASFLHPAHTTIRKPECLAAD